VQTTAEQDSVQRVGATQKEYLFLPIQMKYSAVADAVINTVVAAVAESCPVRGR
jgi:hypothetical protein